MFIRVFGTSGRLNSRQNDEAAQIQKHGGETFSLNFGPHLLEKFGIPPSATISKLLQRTDIGYLLASLLLPAGYKFYLFKELGKNSQKGTAM